MTMEILEQGQIKLQFIRRYLLNTLLTQAATNSVGWKEHLKHYHHQCKNRSYQLNRQSPAKPEVQGVELDLTLTLDLLQHLL